MRKSKIIVFLVMFIIITQSIFFLYGCKSNEINKKSGQTKTSEEFKVNRLKEYGLIYEYTKDIDYKIYSSEVIDVYIIATALSKDFRCQNIMPNLDQYQMYVKAKEHFSKYKNHDFIKELDKFTYGDDINCDIALLINDYFKLEDKDKLDILLNRKIFNSKEEMKKFIDSFKKFYVDSEAENFLKDNSSTYAKMNDYIKNNIEQTKVTSVISEIEKYVGNKNKYYSNEKIKYETVLTLYRPFMAMFNNVREDNTTRIISFQSPNDFSRNPEKFDINQMVSSTSHEFLHSYINKPVENENNLIKELSNNKSKSSIISSMYENMPWNRVVDENFVRAVQGRIYKNIFNEERAFSEVLNKEIKAGFSKLEPVYCKLDEYEIKKDKYKSIDNFIPELIKELFR